MLPSSTTVGTRTLTERTRARCPCRGTPGTRKSAMVGHPSHPELVRTVAAAVGDTRNVGHVHRRVRSRTASSTESCRRILHVGVSLRLAASRCDRRRRRARRASIRRHPGGSVSVLLVAAVLTHGRRRWHAQSHQGAILSEPDLEPRHLQARRHSASHIRRADLTTSSLWRSAN